MRYAFALFVNWMNMTLNEFIYFVFCRNWMPHLHIFLYAFECQGKSVSIDRMHCNNFFFFFSLFWALCRLVSELKTYIHQFWTFFFSSSKNKKKKYQNELLESGLMLAMHENHTVVEREQKTLKCFKFAMLHTEHCTLHALNEMWFIVLNFPSTGSSSLNRID